MVLAGLLLAWPLASLLRGGGLGAALGLSAVAGLCVLGLWRSWPVWRGCAREGGPLARHWQALDAREWLGMFVVLAGVALVTLPSKYA